MKFNIFELYDLRDMLIEDIKCDNLIINDSAIPGKIRNEAEKTVIRR